MKAAISENPGSASREHASASMDILVVDDTPANLQLLSVMLKQAGYGVRVVPSGAMALRAVQSRRPDLILLDITMPDMDGYEVCSRLKQQEGCGTVPVIFISALAEPIDKVRAFGSGGVDYVTKPFQIEEVGARVRTHLELRRLQLEVEERARQLQAANDALRETERLRDNLVHMIVHYLRTPLGGVLASLQFMADDVGPRLEPASREDLRQATASAERLNRMVNELLNITQLEAGKLVLERTTQEVAALLEQAVSSLGGLAKGRRLRVTTTEGLTVHCDAELMRRVLVNLLGNALRFTPTEGSIEIKATRGEAGPRFSVRDEGPGIDSRYHSKIFEKFGQVEARQNRAFVSSGLGLAFCRLAVEAHGGRIGVESQIGQGSSFWVELPDE